VRRTNSCYDATHTLISDCALPARRGTNKKRRAAAPWCSSRATTTVVAMPTKTRGKRGGKGGASVSATARSTPLECERLLGEVDAGEGGGRGKPVGDAHMQENLAEEGVEGSDGGHLVGGRLHGAERVAHAQQLQPEDLRHRGEGWGAAEPRRGKEP